MREVYPEQVFREYDIRGIAGEEITPAFAYDLARAYAQVLPVHIAAPIVVGRDVRLSGLSLQQAVMQGLIEQGLDVIDIGMVPTPLAYYGVHQLHAAGCIMVTASHNPSAYNGFKLMVGKDSFFGEDLQRLKQLMLQGGFLAAPHQGLITCLNLIPDYSNFVAQDCMLACSLKVVIDAGNGPSGLIAAPLYRRLGCEVIELYCEPDGNFPNHHPDPTIEENLQDMADKVRETGADLGIAFDGDGDRIGVVDEHGQVIWGDMLLLLLSRLLLQQHPGATIISEVKSSQLLYEDIEAHGGKAVMWRTGHAPVKQKMKETGALLAGEMSGHFFFADRFLGFDDAVYAGARVMELLAAEPDPLSTLLEGVPQWVSTTEKRVYCSDERKFDLVIEAVAYFSEQGYAMIDIDGMRLVFDDGWALLRASNTQPALVLRCEASHQSRLLVLSALLDDWLAEHMEKT